MNGLHKFFTVPTALALLAVAVACSSEKRNATAAPEVVRDVPVFVAQRASIPDYVEEVGSVRAAQTAQVASQIMGTLVRVLVREGDRVRAGQVLAIVEETQPRAGMERAQAALRAAQQDVAAAEAEHALAESTLKRYQSLYEKKSVSPQEFEEVKTRLTASRARRDAAHAGKSQAEAALAQARSGYEYTRVRAPFNGTVTAKLADAGTLATPGMPIFVIEDTSRFRLETNVDERAIGTVHLGREVPVVIEALGPEPVNGKVVQIVPAADPSSRSFLVKVELPAMSQLRSGLFGRVRFEHGTRESLQVPRTALIRRGQLDGLYVLGEDQIANLRYVTLGRTDAGIVEVLSGLEHGERIVAEPRSRELSGKRIEVR